MTMADPAGMGFREAAAPYLFDAVPEPLLMLNADGVITGVNTRAARMFGVPARRLVGDHLTALLRPGDGEPVAPLLSLDSLVSAAGDLGTSAICRHESGRDVHVEVRCAPVTTASGAGIVASIHDMTAERERAESSRAGSERLLRIAEAVRVGVGLIRTDPPGFGYTNPTFREMAGGDELHPGRPGLPPTETAQGRALIERALCALRSGRPVSTAEVRLTAPNDDARWVRMTTGMVTNATGACTELAVTLEDITAFKVAEAALRNSEQLLLEMAATIEIGFLLKDVADQRLVYVSPGFMKIFGFDPAGPSPGFLDLREMIHPDDRAALAAATEIVEAGASERRDLRIVRPDGQRWVRFTANPIMDADGDVVRMAVTAEEFTAGKEADMAIRLSEDRFRRMADAIGVGISLRQLQPPRFLYVNARYVEMVGYDPTLDDAYSVPSALARVHPDDRDGVLVDYWERTTKGLSAQVEMRVTMESGGTRWVRVTNHPVPVEQGEPELAAGTIEDITDQKAAEAAAQPARRWAVAVNAGTNAPSDDVRDTDEVVATQPAVLLIQGGGTGVEPLRRILRKRPVWSVHHAHDGAVGLELAASQHPQLIMMDLHLPDMSAADLLRALRCRTRTAHIPVFVLSADADRGDLARLRVLGAQGFFSQPLDVSEVLRILDASNP